LRRRATEYDFQNYEIHETDKMTSSWSSKFVVPIRSKNFNQFAAGRIRDLGRQYFEGPWCKKLNILFYRHWHFGLQTCF